jgi:hypothetical protein
MTSVHPTVDGATLASMCLEVTAPPSAANKVLPALRIPHALSADSTDGGSLSFSDLSSAGDEDVPSSDPDERDDIIFITQRSSSHIPLSLS